MNAKRSSVRATRDLSQLLVDADRRAVEEVEQRRQTRRGLTGIDRLFRSRRLASILGLLEDLRP